MKKFKFLRLFFCLILFFGFLGGFYESFVCARESEEEKMYVLTVNGPIVPVTDRYVERGISLAEKSGASACIIELSTPGGLYSSTQDIVSRIVNARVPVVVFVYPHGGWAASAGTFITVASHLAVMAPGTRIGAAHPVSIGEQGQEGGVPEEKITEDAVSWARSLAQMRGRNTRSVELAVRESKSYSDQEALKAGMIDGCASNMGELLFWMEGKKVKLSDGSMVEISTRGLYPQRVPMNYAEKFLASISNPQIAYLLFTLGMAGLLAELYHPGAVFPGVLGGLSLITGLYALGTLDAYWGGILLIILAFGLFAAETFLPSYGFLGAGGLISFALGSFLLFSSGAPGVRIGIEVIAANTIVMGVLMGLLVTAIIRGQKRRIITGQEGMIGEAAVARTVLAPEGTVSFGGGLWNAVVVPENVRVESGEEVIIAGIKGLQLQVTKKNNNN